MAHDRFASLRHRLSRRAPLRIEEPETVEAAVAIVLAPSAAGDIELLLIKRSDRAGDPWSGQIALPGGRRDPGDRDLLHTVCRETLEETGIRLSPEALLGELDDLRPRTPVLPQIVVRPFVFGLGERPVVQVSTEVALHVWASLRRLRASGRLTDVEVRGERLAVPSMLAGPHVVWGITQRILQSFIELAC